MGEITGIQWCDHTFNPWWGCQRVSEGCEHCYAETFAKRLGHGTTKAAIWGPTAERRLASDSYWRQPLKWNRDAAKLGERHRVFCASMADVFEDRAELAPWRARLFCLIQETPHLDWLLLTKRPQHARRLWANAAIDLLDDALRADVVFAAAESGALWASNVWLGTTVENQRRADERIPQLLASGAAVKFLSCEPLLEAVDLGAYLVEPMRCRSCDSMRIVYDTNPHNLPPLAEHPTCALGVTMTGEPGSERCGACGSLDIRAESRVNWIIVGGESGAGARRFDLGWMRSLVAQARAGGVAPFCKQLGARPVGEWGMGKMPQTHDHPARRNEYVLRDGHGGDMSEWPADLRVREFSTVSR